MNKNLYNQEKKINKIVGLIIFFMLFSIVSCATHTIHTMRDVIKKRGYPNLILSNEYGNESCRISMIYDDMRYDFETDWKLSYTKLESQTEMDLWEEGTVYYEKNIPANRCGSAHFQKLFLDMHSDFQPEPLFAEKQDMDFIVRTLGRPCLVEDQAYRTKIYGEKPDLNIICEAIVLYYHDAAYIFFVYRGDNYSYLLFFKEDNYNNVCYSDQHPLPDWFVQKYPDLEPNPQQQIMEARNLAEKALELDPDNAAAKEVMGKAEEELGLGSWLSVNRQMQEYASTLFNYESFEDNEYSSEEISALVEKALNEIMDGNLEEAARVLVDCADLDPANPAVLTARGILLLADGDRKEATKTLKMAIYNGAGSAARKALAVIEEDYLKARLSEVVKKKPSGEDRKEIKMLVDRFLEAQQAGAEKDVRSLISQQDMALLGGFPDQEAAVYFVETVVQFYCAEDIKELLKGKKAKPEEIRASGNLAYVRIRDEHFLEDMVLVKTSDGWRILNFLLPATEQLYTGPLP